MMYPARVASSGHIRVNDRTSFISELSDGYLEIGTDVEIGSDCRIDFSGGLTIGDRTHISSQVMLLTHTHGVHPRSVPAGCRMHIGKDVWIGSRAIILESVAEIGDGAIIGAGSILTHKVPAGEIWAGNPARRIRAIDATAVDEALS